MDRNIKILVVDDFATMRRIAINLLAELGFDNTVEASDGAEALALLQSDEFDLLVTDWKMPTMTGLELLATVRASPELAELPVLMVSVEARRHRIEMAVDAGVNGYLVKPFTTQTLRQSMQKIFDPAAATA